MASIFENKNSSRITIWNDGKKVKLKFSKYAESVVVEFNKKDAMEIAAAILDEVKEM